MDRGRSGGFITDNNYLAKRKEEKRMKEHNDRLLKIKNRKPGSSNTLDNNPPNVLCSAGALNPRKVALKIAFNVNTEKENKSLLKRISAILTAPPKITDKDYKVMKKLVNAHLKGTNDSLTHESLGSTPALILCFA